MLFVADSGKNFWTNAYRLKVKILKQTYEMS